MNSPLENRKVRLRGLGGPAACGVPNDRASATMRSPDELVSGTTALRTQAVEAPFRERSERETGLTAVPAAASAAQDLAARHVRRALAGCGASRRAENHRGVGFASILMSINIVHALRKFC